MTDREDVCQGLLREARRYRGEGRDLEAIAAYRQLLTLRPQLPDSWYNLALLQRRAGQYGEALASYQQALVRGVERPEEVHLNRALILSAELNRYPDAERELETALRLNPAYIPALVNLANLHEDLGRREAAAQAYERILSLEPGNPEALARYANMRSFSDPADAWIGRLRRALIEPQAAPSELASVGFALGRALDACGEYDAAFDACVLANHHSRRSAGERFRPYDRTAHERLIDRIIEAFPAAAQADRQDPPAGAQPSPIFVCGMFRSGSTLTEQLLAGHPRITPGGEIGLVPRIAEQALAPYPEGTAAADPQRLRILARQYRDALAARHPGSERVTDKRPDNFLYLGLIKRLFPGAKIVHTTREPLDNCLSIFFLHLDPRMSYALDLMDIGHYYREYTRLMAHWKASFPGDILDVHYDSLVREPRPVMERLLDFLGLEWSDRCLEAASSGRAVTTASVWQVREPLYQRSSGRARHYSRRLFALREYLGSGA